MHLHCYDTVTRVVEILKVRVRVYMCEELIAARTKLGALDNFQESYRLAGLAGFKVFAMILFETSILVIIVMLVVGTENAVAYFHVIIQ